MKPALWWTFLRDRWPGLRRRAPVTLQPLGLGPVQQHALNPLLEALGEHLALRFEFGGDDSDLVFMSADYASGTPSSTVKQQVAGRPVLLLEGALDAAAPDATGATPRAVQEDLLRQLLAMPVVRERAGAPAADMHGTDRGSLSTVFDSAFGAGTSMQHWAGAQPDAEQRALVHQVLRGLHDDSAPALAASYGPGAGLRINFRSRLVLIEPQALQGLRVRGELPRCCAEVALGEHAQAHDLDEMVWHLGIACGRFVLLDQPDDPWHAPLVGPAASQIQRFSRQPRHLELARLLLAGPTTPAELSRQVSIDALDLRCFLQACLFLGLLRWAI